MDFVNFLLAKSLAERQGVSSKRALQLGLVASMMPTTQGVLVSTLISRREAEATRGRDAAGASDGGNSETPTEDSSDKASRKQRRA